MHLGVTFIVESQTDFILNEFLSTSMTLGHHTITVFDLVEVVLVILMSRIILGLLRRALRRAERFSTLDEGKRFIVHRMVSSVVWTISTLTVLSVLGLDLTAVWAGSAALMVGVGIGLQGFFNDVISGFVLMFEGGVAVGNVIDVDGKLVRVERIDLRSTRVVSTDGELLVLPNAKVAGDAVVNMSQGEVSTRIKVNVGVAYGSDVDLVQRLLMEAMSEQPETLASPEPRVFFQDFGDSSLDFSVMGWVSTLGTGWPYRAGSVQPSMPSSALPGWRFRSHSAMCTCWKKGLLKPESSCHPQWAACARHMCSQESASFGDGSFFMPRFAP